MKQPITTVKLTCQCGRRIGYMIHVSADAADAVVDPSLHPYHSAWMRAGLDGAVVTIFETDKQAGKGLLDKVVGSLESLREHLKGAENLYPVAIFAHKFRCGRCRRDWSVRCDLLNTRVHRAVTAGRREITLGIDVAA